MKRTVSLLSIMLVALSTVAQPPARQRQQAAKAEAETQQAQTSTSLSERAALEFPTQGAMPEDVAWRRDVYKVLDLSTDRNAVLYYPEEPQGTEMNLFTNLFKMVLRKQVKAYEYTIDGNANFNTKNVMKPLVMLERFEIAHETNGDKIRVEDADIPSSQIKSYYIKESTYYDQNTAQFHTQVTAICPVRRGIGEFGEEESPTPLFWIDYAEASPYLSKIALMNSNYNNAALISADDYFTTNQYEGKIYKTVNLQGRVLANYCETDSAMALEQERIEREISTLQDHVWGHDTTKVEEAPADSTLAAAEEEEKVSKKSKKDDSESESNSSRSQVKRENSNATTRFTTRRQRH